MAESAAACTTGLALNAIPWPAAASMSRSLAPSPMAIVRAVSMPNSAANSRSACSLAARSMTGPRTRPVRWPSTTSSPLARTASTPSSSARGPITSVKPPLTSAIR